MKLLYVLLKTISPEFFDKNAIQIALYKHRYQSRKSLLKLDEDRLKDIGISRLEAEIEAKKPFWKGDSIELKQKENAVKVKKYPREA